MQHEWLVTAVLEGERVYFLGMRPTERGPSDVTWTSQRGRATRFQVRDAAEDTAKAMRTGEVVSMWGRPEEIDAAERRVADFDREINARAAEMRRYGRG